jgi:methylenetetrahydrofolate dehydrogenase (NADP+) / methenyltetrahydrofolate cyclohydrolase
MAQILDGKRHAESMLAAIAQAVTARAARGLRPPALAVVLVGEDPASQVYVRGKIAACARTGIRSIEHLRPADTTQADLETLLRALNADPVVDGILLQLPLPGHLDTRAALLAIAPAKDVDGLHPFNQGLLMQGAAGLRPCTPTAVMSMLKAHGVEMRGRHAVVLGRSDLVGKPMAFMLLEEHATVTIAHSRTADLPTLCRQAEILVAAVGRPGLVEGSWIRPGAVVVDVGINQVSDLALGERIFARDPYQAGNAEGQGIRPLRRRPLRRGPGSLRCHHPRAGGRGPPHHRRPAGEHTEGLRGPRVVDPISS